MREPSTKQLNPLTGKYLGMARITTLQPKTSPLGQSKVIGMPEMVQE